MNKRLLLSVIVVLIVAAGLGIWLGSKSANAPSGDDDINTSDALTAEEDRLLSNVATNQAANTSERVQLTGELLALAKARDDARLGNIEALRQALEVYKGDDSGENYPIELSQLVPDYIAAIPNDPKTDQPYAYTPIGTGPNYYDLVYTLEVGVQGIEAGEHSANPGGIAYP